MEMFSFLKLNGPANTRESVSQEENMKGFLVVLGILYLLGHLPGWVSLAALALFFPRVFGWIFILGLLTIFAVYSCAT